MFMYKFLVLAIIILAILLVIGDYPPEVFQMFVGIFVFLVLPLFCIVTRIEMYGF